MIVKISQIAAVMAVGLQWWGAHGAVVHVDYFSEDYTDISYDVSYANSQPGSLAYSQYGSMGSLAYSQYGSQYGSMDYSGGNSQFGSTALSQFDSLEYSSEMSQFGSLEYSSEMSQFGSLGYSSEMSQFGSLEYSSEMSQFGSLEYSSEMSQFGSLGYSTAFSQFGSLGYSSDMSQFGSLGYSTAFSQFGSLGYSSEMTQFGSLGYSTAFSQFGSLGYSSDMSQFGSLGYSSDMSQFGSLGYSEPYSTGFSNFESMDYSVNSFDFSAGFSAMSASASFEGSNEESIIVDMPTLMPTVSPTEVPTEVPTVVPTKVGDTNIPTSIPTSSPSAHPTAVPSEVPSAVPTSFISFFPTVTPSREPTVVPTRNPTRTPTVIPTRSPTEAPTIAPTTLFSQIEASEHTKECMVTCTYPGAPPSADWDAQQYCEFFAYSKCSWDAVADYSCSPACLYDCPDVFCDVFSSSVYGCPKSGTFADKNTLESYCLSNYSLSANTVSEMEFTLDLQFDGTDPDSFNDADTQKAAIAAMSEAMSGVPTNQISITEFSPSRRQLLGIDIEIVADSAKVKFAIQAYLEQLGFTANDGSLAYTSLTDQITSSVSSGQFLVNLKVAAQTAGVSSFDDTQVPDTIDFYEYTVTLLKSAPPTGIPTSAPTRPSEPSGNDLSTGAIAGISIAVIVVVCAVVAVLIVVVVKRKQKLMEDQFNSHGAAGLVPTPMMTTTDARGSHDNQKSSKDAAYEMQSPVHSHDA